MYSSRMCTIRFSGRLQGRCAGLCVCQGVCTAPYPHPPSTLHPCLHSHVHTPLAHTQSTPASTPLPVHTPPCPQRPLHAPSLCTSAFWDKPIVNKITDTCKTLFRPPNLFAGGNDDSLYLFP